MNDKSAVGGGRHGNGTQGRKRCKTRKGNGWTSSRKRNSTTTKEPPPVDPSHLSALERLSKESKKRGLSSSSLFDDLHENNAPVPAPPPASKLKRLQKKPVLEMETPPRNTRGSNYNAAPAPPGGTQRGGRRVMQVRQNPVSLDMPDLSQLSTSPIFAQIKDESMTPPRPVNKQGPYPFSKSYQGQLAYHHGSGGGGGDEGDFHVPVHVQVPVPLPRQRDMVLSSFPNDYGHGHLPPFESLFGSVLASKPEEIDPNQLVCLEVPTSAVEEFTGVKDEYTYHRMIRQQEKQDVKDEQKRIVFANSERLKNILKLPKAHKWVIYEWFYSDIDRALFEGENDFEACLRDCYPTLKLRQMTRVQWVKIRGKMGKPRRSSAKFFEEEREHLANRREKIRMIQRRVKVGEWGNMRNLPEEIPMMLTIGTSVTARVRRPQDGVFQGTVEGVDPSNNTYRICFLREGLGAHSFPDYEVRAAVEPDTISTGSFCMKIPRKGGSSEQFKNRFRKAKAIQEGEEGKGLPRSPFPIDSMLGGFPLRCLELIVRQSKLLKAKRVKLGELSELNVEAEKMRTYGKPYPEEYRRRYATCIVQLEAINEGLEKIMRVIKVYMEEIAEDAVQDARGNGGTAGGSSSSMGKMVYTEKVKENADKEAKDIVNTWNCMGRVKSGKIKELIENMASLMLQVKALGTDNGERKPFELESLRKTVEGMRRSLEGENLRVFQNKVDIPLSRIMAGLCVNPKEEEK